jgi:hypothetical protein
MLANSSIRNSGICLTDSTGCGMLGLNKPVHISFPYSCIMEDPNTPAMKADITRVEESIARIDANIDTLTKLVVGMRDDMLTWKDEIVGHFDNSIQSIEAKLLDFHELEQTTQSHEHRIVRLEQKVAAA